MKKIFYVLLLTAITLQGQTTGVNKLKIASNPEKTTAPRVLVQETNGDVGYVAKSTLQTDISGKVDKVVGKELSSNDYTTAEKTKLSGIASGAEVNVNADWNATSGDAQILNKPTIPSVLGLATETFVNNSLSTKENTISAGTTAQYWRGDKTWQTLPTTGSLQFGINSPTVYNSGGGNIVTNTSFGQASLEYNTTGSNNSAFGNTSLQMNTTGSNNVAFGATALSSNTTGNDNLALGKTSLRYNTTGVYNLAIGNSSLMNNTTASYNLAIGKDAMLSNTTGEINVALGGSSLRNNTQGNSNLAIGYGASYSNTTANNNTSFGIYSLYNNLTGNDNTAAGYRALYFSKGVNNIGIGANSGTDSVKNITTESNQIVIGNELSQNAYIKIGWTVTSDARDKIDFGIIPHGLDFISKLKPVSYRFRQNRNSETAVGDLKYGFKAQDILALEGSNPVIIDAKDPEHLKYTESNLLPVLVNAIKELSLKVSSLESEIKNLKK